MYCIFEKIWYTIINEIFFQREDIKMSLFKKKTNYGKIIAITLAAVAGACAVAFVVYKLIKKYTSDIVYDCDDLLEECDDCDLACDCDCECEELEEAVADAE